MALPAPRSWLDGESPDNRPTADALNLDWRDSFDFLLGYSRPMIYLQSNVSQALGSGTVVTVNWQVEMLKRGGITHSTNASSFVVPYAGQYTGMFMGGFGTMTTTVTRCRVKVLVNGTIKHIMDAPPATTVDMQVAGALDLDLAANDSITMTMQCTNSTSSTLIADQNRPRIALWYAGDFS